ncbi:unnamed protein product [Enterobius vermicularis]|uniref:C-type lectin domain-containing protein n=1 Tax=Enterobius vermicularis TaxID=51028 RepID=A0A0N4USY4_ENTVE|nr:unnamed protein product [Enterobius vermicularis]
MLDTFQGYPGSTDFSISNQCSVGQFLQHYECSRSEPYVIIPNACVNTSYNCSQIPYQSGIPYQQNCFYTADATSTYYWNGSSQLNLGNAGFTFANNESHQSFASTASVSQCEPSLESHHIQNIAHNSGNINTFDTCYNCPSYDFNGSASFYLNILNISELAYDQEGFRWRRIGSNQYTNFGGLLDTHYGSTQGQYYGNNSGTYSSANFASSAQYPCVSSQQWYPTAVTCDNGGYSFMNYQNSNFFQSSDFTPGNQATLATFGSINAAVIGQIHLWFGTAITVEFFVECHI